MPLLRQEPGTIYSNTSEALIMLCKFILVSKWSLNSHYIPNAFRLLTEQPTVSSKMNAISALLVLAVAAFANADSEGLTVAKKKNSIVRCSWPKSQSLHPILANLPLKVPCLAPEVSSFGCAQTNFTYQCSNDQPSAILIASLDCIVDRCGAVTGNQVWSSAQAVCSCVATASSSTTPISTINVRELSAINSVIPAGNAPSPTPNMQSSHATCHDV